MLKNSLGARFHPESGTKYTDLGTFRARFVVAIISVPTFSTRWGFFRTSPARGSTKSAAPGDVEATARIRCMRDAEPLAAPIGLPCYVGNAKRGHPVSAEQNKAVIRRFFDEVVNGQNLDVLDELVVRTVGDGSLHGDEWTSDPRRWQRQRPLGAM